VLDAFVYDEDGSRRGDITRKEMLAKKGLHPENQLHP
jgi:hypothetical protein